ncbi:hypothetical protein evm_004538 [Chilo suppressalis]|nr:hypothetical protein evm_004538 [Chilo suppressalis]
MTSTMDEYAERQFSRNISGRDVNLTSVVAEYEDQSALFKTYFRRGGFVLCGLGEPEGVCVASVVCRFELFFIGRRLIMERKVIRSAAREVILKVKQFCELEKKNNNVLIPLQNVQMRVAAMTGVFVKTVSRITKKGKTAMATSNKIVTPGKSRPQAKKIDLDDFDLCCIRQKIIFSMW